MQEISSSLKVKANHLADTLKFDKHLHSRTLHLIYYTHLRHNLAGERESREVERDGLETVPGGARLGYRVRGNIKDTVPFESSPPAISPVYDLSAT